ncbi:MAG TPA: MBL fold metallo-hydrolase [Puia sp.]|nr:MBL fold metallo-hydrolase [Puia sp.]
MMILLIIAAIILALIIMVYVFVHQPKFGTLATGEALKRIQQSPNFRDGKFQNKNFTPPISEDTTYYKVMKEFFFERRKDTKPPSALPSKKTDLLNLDSNKNVIVWFGHSSYFIQVDGKKILVDPVFSGAASPVKFTTRSFPGSDVYTTDDIPEIDYLFISHDHWDHLDYETVTKLKPKIKKMICGLGVAAHFEGWGFDKNIIIEKDWNEKATLDEGFEITVFTARHFSGRGFSRDKSIWVSYFLKTPTMKIFLGGDSGYDVHFAEIGTEYGPFDIAVLECGQYDKNWKYIHMMPEQTFQAAEDLRAKKLLAVHWAKFALANHAWSDSIKRVSVASVNKSVQLLTPMIGEEVDLKSDSQIFSKWWESI